MKTVVLLTIRDEIKNIYYEELNSIFSDYLNIITYSLEIDHKFHPDDKILEKSNYIIITEAKVLSIVKEYIKPDCKIIQLEYTFLKDKIYALKVYPMNTKALICFKYFQISYFTASLIYQMGITNLRLDVYNPEIGTADKDYDFAIVGEGSENIPDGINRIVSLGRRKVSYSTLINLALVTGILDSRLENRIDIYARDIAMPVSFMYEMHLDSSFSKMKLKTIMDSIDYSILILDDSLRIVSYNDNLVTMFGISKDIIGMHMDAIPFLADLSKKDIINNQVENLVIEIENKMVMATSKIIEKKPYPGNTYILLFKDITEIIALERTLRKQLEKRGHIAKYTFSSIYESSSEIKECIRKAKIMAGIDRDVLIIGESGTGKELFAQSIHNESKRKNFPFVGINCAALPNTLLESELFGYEDGTFTGGRKGGKQGLFEISNNGTIFLDEIGDMPLETQAKLLRVLEEKEIMKLGSNQIISIDVRIIAATNKNIKVLVNQGQFRLDLYYRLNTLMLTIPPLRKRKDDLIYLIDKFLSSGMKKAYTISDEVYNFLINYKWEGNVRELKNCIDYIINMTDGNITMKDLPEYMFDDICENTCDMTAILNQLNRCDQEILLDMMETIERRGGGRRSLYSYLSDKYGHISEYKVRNLIELLSKNNLAEIKKGSRGIVLTSLGKDLLSRS